MFCCICFFRVRVMLLEMPRNLPEHITAMPGSFQCMFSISIFTIPCLCVPVWFVRGTVADICPVHMSPSQAFLLQFATDRSHGTCQRNWMGLVQCGPWKHSILSAMCPSKTVSSSLTDLRLTPLIMVWHFHRIGPEQYWQFWLATN